MITSMNAFAIICGIHKYMTSSQSKLVVLCHVGKDIIIVITTSPCDFNDCGQI